MIDKAPAIGQDSRRWVTTQTQALGPVRDERKKLRGASLDGGPYGGRAWSLMMIVA
jgi:hypothetical protein